MLISFEHNNTMKSVVVELQTNCNFTVLVAAAYSTNINGHLLCITKKQHEDVTPNTEASLLPL